MNKFALVLVVALACGLPGKTNAETSAKWARPAGWDKIAADRAALDNYRCPKPTEFAIVFSWGYTRDLFPKDDAQFEQLLVKAQAAGFNVFHTTYSPARVQLCRKHGVKLMIDFLDTTNHHVFQLPEKCRAVCKAVEGDDAVWGYDVWNDHFGGREEGRQRDIRNVRLWDPSHPAYCGCCSNDDDPMLTNADCLGYYDFHWERGIDWHFVHLLKFLDGARQHDSYLVTLNSGKPGRRHSTSADYFHRSLWSVNTSIACGLKGYSWFLAPMDQKTLQWTASADYINKVNLEIAPLSKELMKIGLPSAVYATKVTRGNEDQALGAAKMPVGLENNGFPAGFWIQPAAGEFVMGVFKDEQKRDAIFLANYNSRVAQDVKLKFAKDVKASLFNRKQAKWQPVEIANRSLIVKLDAGGGELLRFDLPGLAP